MQSISSLIANFREGDESAARLLFKEYRHFVQRIAFRQLGPENDLEEAVQEIFVQIFKSLPKFKGGSSFETWIYRIGVNVCIDLLRHKLRKKKVEIDSNSETKLTDYSTNEKSALDEIISTEKVKSIYTALNTLDKNKRVVLILHDIEEKPLEEIATIVKAPLGTVKSRLFHARKLLKEALQKIDAQEK